MPSIDIPDTPPTSTQELAPFRSNLCELLRQTAKGVMKREFELMNTHDAVELLAAVRQAAEELSAAAATWARLSDSIRDSWHV